MLELRIIDDIKDAEKLVPAWRALLDEASAPEPVITPLWIFAWWRAFGGLDGRTLRLVTFYDNGRLVGLAPLLLRRAVYRHALPFRRLELIATGEDEADEICSDYIGVLAARGEEGNVATALAEGLEKEKLGAWDELVMPTMNGEDPLAKLLEDALAKSGARVTREHAGQCPYITLPASYDDYMKELDSNRRYKITRSMRDLEKWSGPGGYELKRANTKEELAVGRKILHELHEERWSDEGKAGVFSSARFTQFHDEVMPQLLDGVDGSLDLLWLTVKGEPIAAAYNIVYRKKVYFYQSGRKVDVPKGVRPGISIHALAIQRAIAAGYREYDFLNGLSQYKRELSTKSRELVTLRATAPSLRSRALEATRMAAEMAIDRVRRFKETDKKPEAPAESAATEKKPASEEKPTSAAPASPKAKRPAPAPPAAEKS